MNELPEPRTLVDWLLFALGITGSVIMSIFTWNVRRELKKFDALEKRSHQFVTRDELEKKLSDMEDVRERMHKENRDDLQYIRGRVDSIASKP